MTDAPLRVAGGDFPLSRIREVPQEMAGSYYAVNGGLKDATAVGRRLRIIMCLENNRSSCNL